MWEIINDMTTNRLWIYWLQQPDDAWRKKYPYVTKKIDELEKRITKLEK